MQSAAFPHDRKAKGEEREKVCLWLTNHNRAHTDRHAFSWQTEAAWTDRPIVVYWVTLVQNTAGGEGTALSQTGTLTGLHWHVTETDWQVSNKTLNFVSNIYTCRLCKCGVCCWTCTSKQKQAFATKSLTFHCSVFVGLLHVVHMPVVPLLSLIIYTM